MRRSFIRRYKSSPAGVCMSNHSRVRVDQGLAIGTLSRVNMSFRPDNTRSQQHNHSQTMVGNL